MKITCRSQSTHMELNTHIQEAETGKEYLEEDKNSDKTSCCFTSDVNLLISNNLCATK